jgi:rSAM/selenodomain-associated transferase 2
MRAPISVIIPTLNAEIDLPGCLGCLMEGVQAGLIRELIVSDGGSRDGTLGLAQAAGAEIVQGAASRGGQLRRGCELAQGEWLLVLHADTVLEPGWSDAVQAHLPSGEAGYFRLRFRARGALPWLVAGWANVRSAVFGLPYGDQGLLVRRDIYAEAGGYPDQPLMEDVALARALRGRLKKLPADASTSAARYVAEGWTARGARNLWVLVRYYCGADPAALAKAYRRSRDQS